MSRLARNAAVPALILVSVGLVGCAMLGLGGFNLISLDEEWELGAKLAADLENELTLVRDREALQYLNSMGNRMANQTELGERPWQFHLVRDPSINAFNIPGGHVYVHTGLVEAASNASELAGVVGHEVGHGAARHVTQQITRAYGLSIVAGLLLGQNPAIYQQILAQIAASGTMASFGRNAEREADSLGVRIMWDAGYDPEGMLAIFNELLAQREGRPGAVQRFFATHPLTETRMRDVRAEIDRLPPKSGLATDEPGFAALRRASR